MGENISTRVAYGRALAEFGADENIYVFDADLKKCTMTLYFSEKYPEWFCNMWSNCSGTYIRYFCSRPCL